MVPRDEPDPPPAALKQRDKHPGNGPGAGGKGTTGAAPAPKPKPVDPRVLRKKLIQADLDLFEDLTTDGPAQLPKPKPKPSVSVPNNAAGPGPSSARLNGASKLASSAAAAAGGKAGCRGSGAGPARGKAPGGSNTAVNGSKPGGQQHQQLGQPRGNASPAGTAAGQKAPRPGAPGPATNGTGSRTAPTNHQRQVVATPSGRPPQPQGLTGSRPPGHTAVAAVGKGAAAARCFVCVFHLHGVQRANENVRNCECTATRRYDPSRYRDDPFDDRMMEASWRQVVAEEKRSERMGECPCRVDGYAEASLAEEETGGGRRERVGRSAGRMEDEMAEEEEERHRKEKLKRLKAVAKKQRTG
ncbi:hypothetical protein VOLCADRAFT_97833 [Volvox carteri f. nagariensis]|uniref:Uncharacterized protein n=1 Tax=Volvox carteri f. nagariensis TaxID=3068 RepID=D8UDR7_VOLCA|nr:uncharacterized protein VOLCADRAFT_97833 [Volvox carteri f. nagariensis]EFJ42142.1 hypothetical protein VOLCADRAFT_97833 [Volvox carteri f. nagariensis]|eukprot:XP_002956839.1 hypothetical protein VOLCADRAFT_97833 [Volvox carteri f. nagariensis]